MSNLRKDKVVYALWLTKQEENMILELLDTRSDLIADIINQAHKRGDFHKR